MSGQVARTPIIGARPGAVNGWNPLSFANLSIQKTIEGQGDRGKLTPAVASFIFATALTADQPPMTTTDKPSTLIPQIALPVVSGLLLALSLPPLPLGFLAYVGLVPLLMSCHVLTGRAALVAGVVHGIAFYAPSLYWISWITGPGVFAAILYMTLFRALVVWALAACIKRFGPTAVWAAPFIWVGFEYFNSLGDLGFPWAVLALSQSAYLPLIQYADVTGIFGVSFWIVLVNLIVFQLWRQSDAKTWAALALIVVAPLAHGWLTLSNARAGDRTLTVGIAQPNLDPRAKEYRPFDYHFTILKEQTIEAVSQGADLMVWPETAVPAYLGLQANQHYRDRIQHLVDSLDVAVYTGANHLDEYEGRQRSFNSSFLLKPDSEDLPRYDKMRLVPFGERSPFPDLLPWLRNIQFSGGGYIAANWDSGEQFTVFDVGETRFGSMICFDSVFPQQAFELVRGGAQFLVVITNDGYFGKTSGPYQHAQLSVFRAIENRRSVVRSANTGVSTFVDPYGRMSGTTAIFHEAVLTSSVALSASTTFYTRYGNVFGLGCLLVTAVCLVFGWISAKEPSSLATIPERADAEAHLAAYDGPEDDEPMPFLEHLEELRWHLLRGLVGIIVGAIVCGVFGDTILSLLTSPYHTMNPDHVLVTLKPMGMFMVKLNIALVGGVILSLPWLLYQVWTFIAPGLFPTERRYVSFIIISFTICFLVGSTIAYYGVVPLSLRFLVGLTDNTDVVAQFDIGMYIGFVLRLIVAFGVVFEMPVATFFLAKVGLVTSETMRSGRRFALVGGFVLAAFLTPPDPISQLMMALPLILLYEISIQVAKLAAPKPTENLGSTES